MNAIEIRDLTKSFRGLYAVDHLNMTVPVSAGTIGIAAAIGLKYFGCSQVMICDHSDFRLEKAKALGFAVCNNSREDLKAKAMECFGTAPSRFGPTADVGIYMDAAGAEPILELYQSIGKIESRMVVVAVLAGKRPVNVLEMTYSQHALIGSGGYFPEDVEDVIAAMASGKWDIGSIIPMNFRFSSFPGRSSALRRWMKP